MPDTAPNPHEQLARAEKVRRLVDAAIEYNQVAAVKGKAPFTSHDALLLDSDEWKRITDSMGIRRPGLKTRLAVAAELRRMEKSR